MPTISALVLRLKMSCSCSPAGPSITRPCCSSDVNRKPRVITPSSGTTGVQSDTVSIMSRVPKLIWLVYLSSGPSWLSP